MPINPEQKAAALVALAYAGVPVDVQEMILKNNALGKAIEAALSAAEPQPAPSVAVKALEFYANPRNWIDTPSWDGDPDCITPKAIPVTDDGDGARPCDCGDTARAALSALSAQAQDLAVEDVLSEVRRQVEVEGWSADHDDAHDKGEMAGAAACYALEGVTYTAPDHYPPRKKYAAVVDARNSIPEKERETTREAIKLALGEPAAPRNWPWHASWWKPTTTRRNLVKAAALLISEIKRLDRAAAPAKQEG